MESIVELTQRVRSLQPDEGTCYWKPPFPCLLESFRFEPRQFHADDGREREFLIQPFLPSSDLVAPGKWVRAPDLAPLPVGTWILPGHGITLSWRTAQDQDGI